MLNNCMNAITSVDLKFITGSIMFTTHWFHTILLRFEIRLIIHNSAHCFTRLNSIAATDRRTSTQVVVDFFVGQSSIILNNLH